MDDNIIQMTPSEDAEIINIAEDTDEMSLEAFRQLSEAIPALEGIDSLAMMLALPEEDFAAMMPIMLEELEKGFNNSNDKYNLAFMFNSSGASFEEMEQALKDVLEEVNKMDLSENKKNFLTQVFLMLTNSIEDAKASTKRIIRIPIEICHPDAQIPVYTHDTDSGCDVFTLSEYTLEPHSTTLLPLGLKMAIPAGYEIQVRPRSGLSLRSKMRIANSPGTIDAGYRDELGVIVDNNSGAPLYLSKGQRFAQLVLQEVPKASFFVVDSVAEIGENRAGGFGSTGT